ncbi:Ku70 [Coprinopsis cinerea okayama7|uniref:ATP-dependent DNA helicase II subunit 1 n=1 Tax=Coprinopsis cinerea (strain Okayama-7 / 130 / ATCC MYA-4618 / FGSC 9003) TaxID=240176 RepID=A8NVH7_COPC7|nr:Ku70 [Coprinopsis cinerea okayama7\|eukprot:XP_001836717.2 Ku70 [Coprinopsis cinerea okayama7\
MAPYDEWNKIDDEEDEELQDYSLFDGKRDVILFCIDCSESMQELYDHPDYEDVKTSKLNRALDAAMQIEKRKILSGPNDSVGIMLFNTTRKAEGGGYASEIKKGTHLYQPISLLSAPKVQEIIRLLDAAQEDPEELRREFPPVKDKNVPIGDVFTSANWILRDGLDLVQAGVTVEPFFISTEEKPFDVSKFYSSVLLPTNLEDDEELQQDGSLLPESISIARIEDLLEQMRIHESPKRTLFSVPFHLGEGFTIGVKGYALITEQSKGAYKYFADLGDRMEVAKVKTVYVDEDRDAEVDKSRFVFGAGAGTAAANNDGDGEDDSFGVRKVKIGQRKFDHSALWASNLTYSGSKRTFKALLNSMIEKDKIGLALVLMRKNASPVFCYLLPQKETRDGAYQVDPPGIHIIPLPFADDIRAAPFDEALRASAPLVEKAKAFVDKLKIKQGTYPPDAYPNPALAYHNAQLEASAFREEYDPDSFEDLTLPPVEGIHKRAGKLLKGWKEALEEDPSFDVVPVATTGSKRKALKVDQLKEFLRSKGAAVSGKKDELIQRVSDILGG